MFKCLKGVRLYYVCWYINVELDLFLITCVLFLGGGKISLDRTTAAAGAERCECDSGTCMCDFQADDRQTEGVP